MKCVLCCSGDVQVGFRRTPEDFLLGFIVLLSNKFQDCFFNKFVEQKCCLGSSNVFKLLKLCLV